MINVMIDEFTPCLKDARTGELAQTEVIQIKRKSFLKKYKDSLSLSLIHISEPTRLL